MSNLASSTYTVVNTSEAGDLYTIVRSGQVKKQTRNAILTATKESVLEAARNGGTTAKRPTAPNIFEQYFDSTLNKPVWWNGMQWVDATGATV